MKRMIIVLALLAGLAVCGLLVLRHSRRAPAAPPTPEQAHATRDGRDLRAVDAWQSNIKLDLNTDYTPDALAKQRLMERLRHEESKQRPAEGRN